jgi:uncharacterized membrane protein
MEFKKIVSFALIIFLVIIAVFLVIYNISIKDDAGFTELYFMGDLPKITELNKEYYFSFEIHNLEKKTVDYYYSITINGSSISQDNAILRPDEKTMIRAGFTPRMKGNIRVSVELADDQEIHFWTDVI